jgi:transcription elongation factor GreA-like protein
MGGHAMDPAFCVDKLDILSPHNILVRQKEDPEAIEEMIRKNPADLVVEILSHSPDNTASQSELERQLARLLGSRFKKWWTGTKRILVKDPRVASPAKKTDPYVLREVPVRAEDEILDEFFETRNPQKKIAWPTSSSPSPSATRTSRTRCPTS